MANGDDQNSGPNLKLRDYLINLAIEDDMRAELNGGERDRARRMEAILRHNKANPLDGRDVEALLDRNFNAVRTVLRVNQQNT